LVTGCIITDAKNRQYRQSYTFADSGNDKLTIKRADGNGDAVTILKTIELDESLVAFFGLYSGDGAKGSEDASDSGRVIPNISFSQKEKNLVRFAFDQFRKIFPSKIRFTFSLGEDSAFFITGEGKKRLDAYYKMTTGSEMSMIPHLSVIRPALNPKDIQYVREYRPDIPDNNEEYLAFYYHHKAAMEAILTAEKKRDLASVGIKAAPDITVTASLRRPFKKGARKPGGSSRSDEMHLGGLNGIGELFIKMMHEIEDSILQDTKISSSGLVEWIDQPSKVGQMLDLFDFFKNNPFGQINNAHPIELDIVDDRIVGKWSRSSETVLKRHLRIGPLWCYTSGLYLAEGSTPKEALFRMFSDHPGPMALSFTSSEGTSIELVLRALREIFPKDACLNAWKVKVGSQYFPELVMTGLKHGMPMLRGGNSGDGKLRTMEISLAVKDWALDIADAPLHGQKSILREDYSDYYSHVEPTGAGVARIDFWASSTICRWYFPLLMYTVFRGIITDPTKAFYQ
jgi:hypothetical protein